MPTQDKDTEMAIPSQPRKLARKLMQTDLSAYAMGKAAKEGIKKFTAKLPVEVADYPADDADSNNARFKGGKVNKDNTRKADYKTGGDKNAYESVIKRKLIEKFSKYEPAKVVKEAGEPMSPAPATSDNPGFSGDSAMATDNGADNEKTNNSGDEENETVNGVREKLENIAMMSAEMFENLQDDTELDKHVIEKLELAHNFIEAVSKEINDSNGGDDEEDEPEGNQGGKDDNNIAKPSAFKGNGEQSMAKEEYTPPKEGDKIDHLPLANQALIRARWAKEKVVKGNGGVAAKEDVNVNEMMHDPMADGGKYARDEIHGRKATGGPLDPPKKKNKTPGVSPLEKSMMKGYKTESLARKAMKTFATKKGA